MCAQAFASDRDGGNPGSGVAPALQGAGEGITPIQQALQDSLFADSQTGWQLLQQTGFLPLFAKYCAEGKFPAWDMSAQGFFDYCTQGLPVPRKLLSNAKDALREIGAPAKLSEAVRQIMGHVFAVGIERWVKQGASMVNQQAPDMGSGIQLALSDRWVVYLIAVAKLKLHARWPANTSVPPVALIMVNAPLEGFEESHLIAPIGEAVKTAFHGSNFALPYRDRQTIADACISMQRSKGNTPVIGVNSDQANQSMRHPEAQRLALEHFGLHTVEFGADGNCAAALQELEDALRVMLAEINLLLYQSPTQEDRMNPTTPQETHSPGAAAGSTANAATVIHVHGTGTVIGNVDKLAQANASGSSAIVANTISYGLASADLPALLSAFLAAAQQTPTLTAQLPLVEQMVGELQTQVQQTELDVPAAKGFQRVLNYLELTLNGISNGGVLLQKLADIKAAALERYSTLQSLFSSTPGGGA